MRIDWRLEAQKRLTVVPGTLSGSPASSAARRAMLLPCRCSGYAQPTITSPTSAGSSCGTCASTDRIACATRSSGRASTSEPFRARPTGVRVAATMTASDKSGFSCQSAYDDQLLHLARPFVERGNARVAQVLPDRILVDVP